MPTALEEISPLAHAYVIPSGTYHFERAATIGDRRRQFRFTPAALRGTVVTKHHCTDDQLCDACCDRQRAKRERAR